MDSTIAAMKKLILVSYVAIAFICLISSFSTGNPIPFKNGSFTGESPPGSEPELFAPGVVTKVYQTKDIAISPDGNEIYFLSDRPGADGSGKESQDIWVMARTENGWSEPYNLGPPVNSSLPEIYPSMTSEGTIYFTSRNLN